MPHLDPFDGRCGRWQDEDEDDDGRHGRRSRSRVSFASDRARHGSPHSRLSPGRPGGRQGQVIPRTKATAMRETRPQIVTALVNVPDVSGDAGDEAKSLEDLFSWRRLERFRLDVLMRWVGPWSFLALCIDCRILRNGDIHRGGRRGPF